MPTVWNANTYPGPGHDDHDDDNDHDDGEYDGEGTEQEYSASGRPYWHVPRRIGDTDDHSSLPWRSLLPLGVTIALVLAFAALLVSFIGASGGLTVRLSPFGSGNGGNINALTADTPTDTPLATASASATDTVQPTVTDTPASPPPTATATPAVVSVSFPCASAQSKGQPAAGQPWWYHGQICLSTAANATITIAVSYCSTSNSMVLSGQQTDASGTDTVGFTITSFCPPGGTMTVTVTGTAPSGQSINGSTSFVVAS
jgi:hypothetical protein